MTRSLPTQVTHRLDIWYRTSALWQGLHYFLGITGTLSSLAVATKPVFMSVASIDTAAIVSSMCIVLLAFLIPSRRANAMRNGWRLLSIASERYILDESYSLIELLAVAEKCEERIAVTDPS